MERGQASMQVRGVLVGADNYLRTFSEWETISFWYTVLVAELQLTSLFT